MKRRCLRCPHRDRSACVIYTSGSSGDTRLNRQAFRDQHHPSPLVKYASSSVPVIGFEGDIEQAVLYAGESCSLVNDIKPAGQVVRDLVTEAQEVINQMNLA